MILTDKKTFYDLFNVLSFIFFFVRILKKSENLQIVLRYISSLRVDPPDEVICIYKNFQWKNTNLT